MTGLELREIRKKLTFSRESFAALLDISIHTLDSWEQGKRNIPEPKAEWIQLKIKDIVPMKVKFVDGKLLTGDELNKYIEKRDAQEDLIQTLKVENLLVNDPSEIFKTKSGNIYTENSDGSYTITVPMVPFEAYASYVNTFTDEVSIVDDWEKVTFNVDRIGRGKYLGFKTKGDSMNGGQLNDTPDRALILARELGKQHWKDGFNPTDYGWIIISKYSIMHKDIIGFNKETGEIRCHSRNNSPEYQDFDLKLNDIYKIFKVIKRTF